MGRGRGGRAGWRAEALRPGFPALELPGPGDGGSGPEPTVKDGPEAQGAPSVCGERRREAGEWGHGAEGGGLAPPVACVVGPKNCCALVVLGVTSSMCFLGFRLPSSPGKTEGNVLKRFKSCWDPSC